jgi:hypothetical protein
VHVVWYGLGFFGVDLVILGFYTVVIMRGVWWCIVVLSGLFGMWRLMGVFNRCFPCLCG